MLSLFISAAHKSSGKTTLSLGLCAALRERQLHVQPFKKGPDYIDPLWLSAASGYACHNLDFNTMTHDEIRQTVTQYGSPADISLIEANKGLFDGVALDGSDSNAALAKLIKAPVFLVIDTSGMTRGIAPLLLGYQNFDPDIYITGVILNRVGGPRHATKLRQAVEAYTDLKVLGAVQNNPQMVIKERHLGLMPSNEVIQAEQQIIQIRDLVNEQVDVDSILELAEHHKYHTPSGTISNKQQSPAGLSLFTDINTVPVKQITPTDSTNTPEPIIQPPLRIGVCQDPAFGFYYPGDLIALQQAGAEIIRINTLSDPALPELDGLFIGGGFPETCMHQLAANQSMRQSIYRAIENGLPVYAECGGLMYLSCSLYWGDEHAEMVGIIPGDIFMHKKPQGRGYVRLQETPDMLWPGGDIEHTIQAHEFHYSGLENLTDKGRFAYRMLRGTGIDGQHDGWIYKNLLASYTHLRHTSQFPWAQRFTDFIRTHKQGILRS